MGTQSLVNKLISVVKLAQKPKPLDCITLANSIITIDDPFSDFLFRLSKNHLELAQKIFSNISSEGNIQGALHRALVHIETAKKYAIDYYTSKLNNSAVNFAVPWSQTAEAKRLANDIAKLTFYQLLCHKLLGSKEELMKSLLLEMPCVASWDFGDYKEPIANFFSEEWDVLYGKHASEGVIETMQRESCTFGGAISSALDALTFFLKI